MYWKYMQFCEEQEFKYLQQHSHDHINNYLNYSATNARN